MTKAKLGKIPCAGKKESTMTISEDDLCATCQHCAYRPARFSGCELDWPGLIDKDGKVQKCRKFDEQAYRGSNVVSRRTLTVTITGAFPEDMGLALDEVKRLVEDGMMAGLNKNETGSFVFTIQED